MSRRVLYQSGHPPGWPAVTTMSISFDGFLGAAGDGPARRQGCRSALGWWVELSLRIFSAIAAASLWRACVFA